MNKYESLYNRGKQVLGEVFTRCGDDILEVSALGLVCGRQAMASIRRVIFAIESGALVDIVTKIRGKKGDYLSSAFIS